MDEAIVDEWYRWLGVAIVSVAVLTVGTALPDRHGPDAAGVATTVDAVAASDHPATGEHPLTAEAVRVRPGSIALRTDGSVSTASLAYAVTPADGGDRLRDVLHGRPPAAAFATPDRFARAADQARERPPGWRQTGESLLVRRVSWEGVDVTLVGT